MLNIRKVFKKTIYKLIEIIEKSEYKDFDFEDCDENPLKKIINILPMEEEKLLIKTDYGFVPIHEMNMTAPMSLYELELENGMKMDCADNHIVFTKNHEPKFVQDLSENDYVLNENDYINGTKIKSVKKLSNKQSLFDITVDSDEHSYFTNGMLSHNTVSASIVILHFITFNNDKGVMIVANKGATVAEIIDKIKSIYKHLPFFLKKGVINWNQKSITLENGCRVKTENRSKEPAIGFTIDLLYLDEFAHIPNNIAEPYFGAAVPTVSSIDGSKIIITSTPKGYNLFHKLYTGATLPDGDEGGNPFTAMTVYWWQVAGRLDTILQQDKKTCDKYGIVIGDVLKELENNGLKHKREFRDTKVVYRVLHDKKNSDNTDTRFVRSLRVKGIPLPELCFSTNWEESETKLIGSKKMFQQEYNIAFLSGDDLLFDANTMLRLTSNVKEFSHIEIPKFDDKLKLPYVDLTFIDDIDKFNIKEAKNYHMIATIDLAEGLGQDFTVMNLFRLMMKSSEEIEKNKHKYSNMYDYFQLVQVGFFRNRFLSVKEFSELFYMTMFELFDAEKCKCVLEYNTYGGDFLNCLPNVFLGENEYSNSIFLRYKHRVQDLVAKKGLKITKANKNLMIKDYQDAVKRNALIVSHQTCIEEIKMFTKKETPSGEFTFQCESGHDDTVMTLVNLSSAFNNIGFKDLVDNYVNYSMSPDNRRILESYLGSMVKSDAIDYSGFSRGLKKGRRKFINNPFSNKY